LSSLLTIFKYSFLINPASIYQKPTTTNLVVTGNGNDRGGGSINGKVGGSDREGGGGISEGTLVHK
jgi:hypothetical protein